jgi:sensor c-di-GMP phosphodiesterase-like protein
VKSRNIVSPAIVALLVVAAIVGGLFGAWFGAEYQRSEDQKELGKLRDKIRDEYVELFSDLLNKVAELSKSKHKEVATKGFDVLTEIFLTAANINDIVRQREVLCSSSAEMAFMRAANLTLNANLTTLYKEMCKLYARMVPITVRPDVDPQSLLEIIQAGAEIALKLVELDNIIAKDP